MQKHLIEQDSKCPFRPQINKRSAQMMASKSRYTGDFEHLKNSKSQLESEEQIHDRLYGLSLIPKQEPEIDKPFHPQLNLNSIEMVNLMKEEQDYEAEDRWMFLYENGR